MAWWRVPASSASGTGGCRRRIRLVLQPVALGDGLPLFAGLAAPFVLDLIEARAYADGAVLHVYRPARGRTA
jgi:hypothetical protein